MRAPRHTQPVTHQDVAKGAGTALLSRLGAVIEVVSQPAYTWMFGLATYGLYTVLWSLVNLIENIADLGMTDALQRTMPQTQDEREAVSMLKAALFLGVLPSIAVATLATLCAPLVAPWFNVAPKDQPELITAIRLFAWALPLWAFIEVATSAARARRAFGPEIRLRIFWEQILRLFFALILWLAGGGILALLIAHLASLTVTAAGSVRLLSRIYDLRTPGTRMFDRAVLNRLSLAGASVLPANIIARLLSDGPPVLINFWIPGAAGATAAGLYGIARKVSSIPQMIRMAFSYVMGPLASAQARHDRGAIQDLFAFSTRLSVFLVLPLGTILLVSGDLILRLFAHGAAAAWPMLIALTVARIIEALCGPANAVQRVIGHLKWPLLNSLVGLAIALALTAVLLAPLKQTGVAIGVGTGLVVTALLSYAQLARSEGLHAFVPPFGRVAGVSIIASLLLALLVLATRALLPDIVQGVISIAGLALSWAVIWRLGLTEADRRAFARRKQKAEPAPL